MKRSTVLDKYSLLVGSAIAKVRCMNMIGDAMIESKENFSFFSLFFMISKLLELIF